MKNKNVKNKKPRKLKQDKLPDDLVSIFKRYDNRRIKKLFREILKEIEG